MAQLRKFMQFRGSDVFGFVVGAVVGVSLLIGIFCLKDEGVVFLQATMPFELSADAELADVEPADVETADIEAIEQRLVDQLYQEDQAAVHQVAENDEHWRVVRMRVTAYCPCAKCCGKFSDGITANNHKIRPGNVFVAADKAFKFKTEMVVPGYNANEPVQVKDRGRLIKGNRLDVFFHSHRVAKKWGTRYLDVLVREK